jgi:hypothetical protein
MPAATHPLPTEDRTTPRLLLTVPGTRETSTAGETAVLLAHPTSTRIGATTSPGEDGSLVTEYGLLAVVAATIAGVVISWASNGALVTLFNALLRHARGLVGA